MTGKNKAIIASITPGSIAYKQSIEPGDCLLTIDNSTPKDLIDYQFLIYGTDKLTLTIQKRDLSIQTIYIKKKHNEDLGLIFESGIFDRLKICNNKCIFCFVDQQPKGLRKSLYIKDDDYRLSYLQGTYITLTNITKLDKERIEKLRLGPLYVSVHTTNPVLREKMLGNPKAKNIMDDLKWLESLMIPIHCQIVLCPTINDSEELIKTLNDLLHLENVESIAIVPVGITLYRQDDTLKSVNKEIARETISISENYNCIMEKKIIFPSDEFYFLAEMQIPDASFYETFPQLEDGVGSARIIQEDFNLIKLPEKIDSAKKFAIISSSLGSKIIQPIVDRLNRIINLKIDLIEVKNTFWGDKVTVTGLIVGNDVIKTMEQYDELPDTIFIPSVMIRKFSNDFLDNVTIKDIETRFNVKIILVQNYYSFKEVVNFILQ